MPGDVGQSRADPGIANGWHEFGEDGGLVASEIGWDHASVTIEDGLWTEGLGPVFGLEVDLRDSREQSEDPERGFVAAVFFFGGGSLIEPAQAPSVRDKLGVSFWDYLGSRLDIPGAPPILPLPDLIRQRAAA